MSTIVHHVSSASSRQQRLIKRLSRQRGQTAQLFEGTVSPKGFIDDNGFLPKFMFKKYANRSARGFKAPVAAQ